MQTYAWKSGAKAVAETVLTVTGGESFVGGPDDLRTSRPTTGSKASMTGMPG
ncbi:MAG: hypothetical protein AAGF11_24930 [Myxococcota bacterium]